MLPYSVSCILLGGLGNQLFEIFNVISYAMDNWRVCKFKNTEVVDLATNRYTYWKTMFDKLAPYLESEEEYSATSRINYSEPWFPFSQIPEFEEEHVQFHGYFQSYKFFEKNYSKICRFLDINGKKQILMEKIFSKYGRITENNILISLHFRLGDYKKHQYMFPLMPVEYYEKALATIIQETKMPNDRYKIFYFCEEEDYQTVANNINILCAKYPIEFIRGTDTLEDWEQMLFMSICHHNIIANSTFSWWGAYLNSYPEKIVCYPSLWFGSYYPVDTKDLCPEKWRRIQV